MGRTKRGILLGAALAALTAPAAEATPGDLDPTFGKDGKTYLSHYETSDLAVGADGSTVAVGDGVISRVTPSGKLDKGFGKKGYVGDPFEVTFGDPAAVAIQPDGKIVVAGTVTREQQPPEDDIAVARYLTTGQPDPSFAGTGVAVLSTADPNGGERAADVAIAGDGKILVAGVSDGGGLIARFNADGTPDPSFAGVGFLRSTFGFAAADLEGVGAGPGGSVVAAGTAPLPMGKSDMLAVRVDATGTPDPAFDGDGVQTVSVGDKDDAGELEVRPDGGVVLGGSQGKRSAFAQLTPAGALDSAFSGDGVTSIASLSYTADMDLDADGSLYAIDGGVSVIRLTAAGAPDQGFSRGVATISLGGAFAVGGDSLEVAPDGRVMAAGSALLSKDDAVTGLARLRVDAGPDDADADGITDLEDTCPLQAGKPKHDGCPLVKRKLKLNDKQGHFHGNVSVSAPGTELFEVAYRRCLFLGKVAVYAVRRGPDKKVGSTGASTSWSVDKRIGNGKYYARLKAQVYDDTSLCAGAKSKVFRG